MGYNSNKNMPPMERELNTLLYDLCVIWGFCIPTDDHEKISKTESYQADKFARDILIAEGMNPEYENMWVKKIAKKFRERFGGDEIYTSHFVDRVRDPEENW